MNVRRILSAYVRSTAYGKRLTNRGPFWNFWQFCDIVLQWGKELFFNYQGKICLCLVGPETTVCESLSYQSSASWDESPHKRKTITSYC